jgi:hypothetical protein
MWVMLGVIVVSTAILLTGPMRRMREFPRRAVPADVEESELLGG